MIQILEKSQCCGCNACAQACPKQCIQMQEDEEGFMYPHIDETLCVDCGLCEKVCPVINQNVPRKPRKVYAAKHPNDKIRLNSSSGGIFTYLAEQIINDRGVVFGARFDEAWQVVHDYTETIEGLVGFRGSKYVQSIIGDTYKSVRLFLEQGRKVMFTGTPCQVVGLKKYLHREYDNLLTVDFVCHGVPSPLVWRRYLDELRKNICAQRNAGRKTLSLSLNDLPEVTRIYFRDKTYGWKNYGFQLCYTTPREEENAFSRSVIKEKGSILEPFIRNTFMRAFLADFILRPSCYACPSKKGKSGSDITIGDLWGVDRFKPSIDDDKGLSLVLIHNEKVVGLFAESYFEEVDYTDVLCGNPSIVSSVNSPIYRKYFWHLFHHGKSIYDIMSKCQSANSFARLRRLLFRKFEI